MTKLAWKPWHQVVSLRDDLRTGDLSLNQFAADLYEVMMQRGERPIYEKPAEFFALTYPTYNLRQLAREVVLRLAGQNDKAVRQLALTYGGGKTHTLITLFHLVNDPEHLPDLPAVHEFVTEIGMTPPKARIAALCADKLDVEKGMEVRSPCGETRWLKQPWSVLAYQIAGDEGLKVLSATGSAEERESAPAENLLQPLLALPAKEGLATLVLIDELLMFAMEKIALAPEWRHRLVNFCQYLTQAATKVDRCCVVASLLASDPRKTDRLGKEIQARTLRHLPARAGGNCRAGGQRGRGRGVTPPVLQARLDSRRGRVPPARRRGPQGHWGGGPADSEGRRGGRGTIPGQLPVPPGPDGGPVRQVDPVGTVPADPRRVADLCPGAAGGREMGPVAADRRQRLPGGPRRRWAFRGCPRIGHRGRDGGIRGPQAVLGGHFGGRIGPGAANPDRLGWAEVPRDGAGRLRHVPPFSAHRPERPDAGTHGALRRNPAGQDRIGEGLAAVGRLQPLARR